MNWLVDNWRTLLPAPWANIGLALVSVVCGAIIGGERERREKPAGLRTLTLVCLGAAAFTMVGFVFASTTADSGRVAAQIVTGIGFLGAGVILHSGGSVIGMTTAATVWVTAAIGMTVGAGYAGAGLGISLLARLVLMAVHLSESKFLKEVHPCAVELVFNPAGGKTRLLIEKVLGDFNIDPAHAEFTLQESETERLQLHLRLSPRHRHELLAHLADMPEVKAIHVGSPETRS